MTNKHTEKDNISMSYLSLPLLLLFLLSCFHPQCLDTKGFFEAVQVFVLVVITIFPLLLMMWLSLSPSEVFGIILFCCWIILALGDICSLLDCLSWFNMGWINPNCS